MAKAKRSGRKKRAVLAIILCVVLVGTAVALGTMWALYRSYPMNFRQDIEQNAARCNIDPLLVAAVIRTESSWKTGAVSSVGATGLMQIMPDTGKWIASKNDWEYSDDKLTDGPYNIRLGSWYVAYLLERFEGNQTLALAAYNAGENNVNKWVSEGRFKEGRMDIPFAETRNFVRKVTDAYEKYKILYNANHK